MKKEKLIANNKKAWHDYFVDDTYECGIVLTGTEIKSVRAGKVSIKESYAKVDNGEVVVLGMNISPYEHGSFSNTDPLRPKKLLLHRQEIRRLIGLTKEKGVTLIPLKIYINSKGLCKVELGLCRGKKSYDKRDAIAKRDADRRMAQAVRK